MVPNKSIKPILVVVDDEIEILNSIQRVLRALAIDIVVFEHPLAALDFIKSNDVAMVISDHRMPELTGLGLLRMVKENNKSVVRVLLSAHQDFDDVATGFNDGVIDKFIAKPWDNKALKSLVQYHLENENTGINGYAGMIGKSKGMLNLFERIGKAAGANVPIFIHGQTGTGKELVAKACHEKSYRAKEPYVAFNCANLSEHLVESQLFGHKKGAFTGATSDHKGLFEQASEGTLFLDEVTTLPVNLQAKLLRVIQEREFMPLGSNQLKKFNAQLISASSTSLNEAVLEEGFRQDLLYRLGVIQLSIPRLNERGKDILSIAKHYLDKYNAEQNKSFKGFSENAEQFMLSYQWPGNVRQLENMLHSVIVMNDEAFIEEGMLREALGDIDKLNAIKRGSFPSHSTEGLSLAEIEKQAILAAIEESGGNITKAAKSLDINPSTIYRKMQSW